MATEAGEKSKLAGAYVQAWVWVEAETFARPDDLMPVQDMPLITLHRLEAGARKAADRLWTATGEIMIDDDALVKFYCERGKDND